jgi:ABC-2 type transport system permease protein
MWFRLYILMRKEFLQFFRNLPLIIIVLYCMTIDVYSAGSVSMDIHDYPLAVYDLSKTEESRQVLEDLREPYFTIKYVIEQEDEIVPLIESGDVAVVVVFPADFSRKMGGGEPAQMQAILDGSISNSSELAAGYIANIVARRNIELIATKWNVSDVAERMTPQINSVKRNFYNPNLLDRWNFSLMEFFVDLALIGLLLIATAMVNEKQFGTIEQLMVTPLRTWEIMIAKIIPMVAVLFIASFICIFVILVPVTGIPIEGSIFAFFFVTLLFVTSISGLGLMVSTISTNLSDTVLFSILLLVPIMFLSGAFVPIEAMPGWMRFLVHFSPLKYYIDLGVGIFLKGNGLLFMWREFLALAAIGAISFTVGAYRFRKVFR